MYVIVPIALYVSATFKARKKDVYLFALNSLGKTRSSNFFSGLSLLEDGLGNKSLFSPAMIPNMENASVLLFLRGKGKKKQIN